MWDSITMIATNLAMSIENIILIIVLLVGFIPYAQDFKIGLVIHFIITSLLAMLYYSLGWNYAAAFVLSLMFLVTICFTLYAVAKTEQVGGYV